MTQQMYLVANMKSGHYLDPRKFGDDPTLKGMMFSSMGTAAAMLLMAHRGGRVGHEDDLIAEANKEDNHQGPWFLDNLVACGDQDTKSFEMEGKEYKNLHTFISEKGEDISEIAIKAICEDQKLRQMFSKKCHDHDGSNDDPCFMLRDILKRLGVYISKEELDNLS
jgi:hypothetical protein